MKEVQEPVEEHAAIIRCSDYYKGKAGQFFTKLQHKSCNFLNSICGRGICVFYFTKTEVNSSF